MRRADESGFALLLVFLMAAIVAIGLYYEMPRVAMETQRQKEQLLIERGEQYKRAIQLFFKKAGRYPNDLKELESFQNQRFLRHRYVDPLTGKDEWRLIHIQNGVLTDSLINKPKAAGDQPSTLGQYIGMQAGALDTQPANKGGALNAKDRRRASEGGNPTTTGPDGQPVPQMPGVQPYPNGNQDPNAPQNVGSSIGAGQGQANPPGLPRPFPAPQPPVQGGNTGGSYIGAQPYVGGGATPGSNAGNPNPGNPNAGNPGGVAYPGQPMPGQQPVPGLPFAGQPGAPGNPQTGAVSPAFAPGAAGAQDPNSAAGLLNRILTTPRPGGMPQPGTGGQTVGGGLAGVASTGEGEGVMIYNDHTKYKEWEFIFDPAKVKPPPNPNVVAGTPTGTPASQIGSMPGQSGMTPVGGGPLNQSPAGATTGPGPRPGQQ